MQTQLTCFKVIDATSTKNAFLFDFEYPGKGKVHKEQTSTDSVPPLRKVYNVPETDKEYNSVTKMMYARE